MVNLIHVHSWLDVEDVERDNHALYGEMVFPFMC